MECGEPRVVVVDGGLYADVVTEADAFHPHPSEDAGWGADPAPAAGLQVRDQDRLQWEMDAADPGAEAEAEAEAAFLADARSAGGGPGAYGSPGAAAAEAAVRAGRCAECGSVRDITRLLGGSPDAPPPRSPEQLMAAARCLTAWSRRVAEQVGRSQHLVGSPTAGRGAEQHDAAAELMLLQRRTEQLLELRARRMDEYRESPPRWEMPLRWMYEPSEALEDPEALLDRHESAKLATRAAMQLFDHDRDGRLGCWGPRADSEPPEPPRPTSPLSPSRALTLHHHQADPFFKPPYGGEMAELLACVGVSREQWESKEGASLDNGITPSRLYHCFVHGVADPDVVLSAAGWPRDPPRRHKAPRPPIPSLSLAASAEAVLEAQVEQERMRKAAEEREMERKAEEVSEMTRKAEEEREMLRKAEEGRELARRAAEEEREMERKAEEEREAALAAEEARTVIEQIVKADEDDDTPSPSQRTIASAVPLPADS